MNMNEELVFGIISYAGTAKGLAYEALNAAEEQKYTKSAELMKEAHESIKEAHKFQTKMIQAEAGGQHTDIHIILIHAQDILMTTMSEMTLIEKLISMHKKIDHLTVGV